MAREEGCHWSCSKPVFLCWWLLLSVLRFCVFPFDQSSQHSPSLFHCNTVHDIIIAVCIPLWSPERLQQSLMYQALGLISIHSALGITKELSFLFLRSFPFRIKFWMAWCLSRGSNEEMMLQNAVLPRCAFSSAPSLSLCLSLLASSRTSWVFSQLVLCLLHRGTLHEKRWMLCGF